VISRSSVSARRSWTVPRLPILLLLTGRPAALSRLSGPGVEALAARLSPARTK
jgi:hypothetical protein